MEKSISFTTKKRNKAINDFDKDFYKLLVNAILSKMMENVRNRLRLELVKKDVLKILLNNNLNYLLEEFINHTKIVIAIVLDKMKFL